MLSGVWLERGRCSSRAIRCRNPCCESPLLLGLQRGARRDVMIQDELHQLVDDLDDDGVAEALVHLQLLEPRRAPGQTQSESGLAAAEATALETWEDEGGGQAAQGPGEHPGERPGGHRPGGARAQLHRLVHGLHGDAAAQALAYLPSLRRPRLLREADPDDEPGTEEEHDAAVEAWQLDRRHALDER